MDIGILGSSSIGNALTRHFTALGHQVSIANSLTSSKPRSRKDSTGPKQMTSSGRRADFFTRSTCPLNLAWPLEAACGTIRLQKHRSL